MESEATGYLGWSVDNELKQQDVHFRAVVLYLPNASISQQLSAPAPRETTPAVAQQK